MTPLRTLVSRSTAGLTRRSVLKYTAAAGAGFLAKAAVEEVLAEGAKAAWTAATAEPPSARSFLAEPLHLSMVYRHGSREQQDAFSAWRAGAPFPEHVKRRATPTYMKDGRRRQRYQGNGIDLFPDAIRQRYMPMMERPDKALSAWSAARLDTVGNRLGNEDARFQDCLAYRDDMSELRFTALLMRMANGDVVSVSNLL
jgi:hypothetical protein